MLTADPEARNHGISDAQTPQQHRRAERQARTPDGKLQTPGPFQPQLPDPQPGMPDWPDSPAAKGDTDPEATPEISESDQLWLNDLYAQLKPEADKEYVEFYLARTPPEFQQDMKALVGGGLGGSLPPPEAPPPDPLIAPVSNGSAVAIVDALDAPIGSGTATVVDSVMTNVKTAGALVTRN